METRLLNIDEAAAFFGVHQNFVRRRTKESWQGLRIPFTRIAGRLKFKLIDLQNYAAIFEGAKHPNEMSADETKAALN